MLLNVVHKTTYNYAPAVKTAQHMAHLRPAHRDGQQLLSHQLMISPGPAQRTETVDAFGNTRSFFGLQSAHESLSVVAESVVRTSEPRTVHSAMAWDDVRERLRYHRAARYDPASEFVFPSPYVPRHPQFLDYARPSFAPGRPLMEAATELAARIHEDFEYEVEATDVGTPALEALALRKGVCQDFAHVMLACLRSLGLAARYVSGYLLTQPPPGQTRLVGSDASHAWASVYVPATEGPGGWSDLDPTNNRAPGEDYVLLALGRDYSDVAPIRGVIHGGARHTLTVGVTVTPMDEAAPGPTIADPSEQPT